MPAQAAVGLFCAPRRYGMGLFLVEQKLRSDWFFVYNDEVLKYESKEIR
jgi:hypothetical protein